MLGELHASTGKLVVAEGVLFCPVETVWRVAGGTVEQWFDNRTVALDETTGGHTTGRQNDVVGVDIRGFIFLVDDECRYRVPVSFDTLDSAGLPVDAGLLEDVEQPVSKPQSRNAWFPGRNLEELDLESILEVLSYLLVVVDAEHRWNANPRFDVEFRPKVCCECVSEWGPIWRLAVLVECPSKLKERGPLYWERDCTRRHVVGARFVESFRGEIGVESRELLDVDETHRSL
jgi:hypothetical protein